MRGKRASWPDVEEDCGWRTAATRLESAVAFTLRGGGNISSALRLVDEVLDEVLDEAQDLGGRDDPADVLALTPTFGQAIFWVVLAGKQGIDVRAAIDWVEEELGDHAAHAVTVIGALVGYSEAKKLDPAEMSDRLGTLFMPALIWLAAGIAATSANGDETWFRQFNLA
jgi:hypothetical protein